MIAPLFEGPVDIVGDVHGEIDALVAVMRALGYDREGRHPEMRRLIFVGDLVDRGPDSPQVAERVMKLVEAGRAQCVLGNHELNLLRDDEKAGNAWFLNPDRVEQQPAGEFAHSKVASDEFRTRLLRFLQSLPLALERQDLRVAHAAWIPQTIATLREQTGSVVDVFRRYQEQTQVALHREGLVERARQEKDRWRAQVNDRNAKVELLEAMGLLDEREQMGNPVKIVTSGVERLATRPFWASGQWRMCDRVRWWNEYRESVPVVVGHYWRRWQAISGSNHAASEPDLFGDARPQDWLGPGRSVFCTDFSVGARYEERKHHKTTFDTRLVALRWPEREVWGESGKAN